MRITAGAMISLLMLSACSAGGSGDPNAGAANTGGSNGRSGATGAGGAATGGATTSAGTGGSSGSQASGGASGAVTSGGTNANGGTQTTGGSTGSGGAPPDLPLDAPDLTPGDWTALNPWGATPSDCGGGAYCAAVDPSNPAVLYQCSCACNGECGIYKSTNAGTSWNEIADVGSGKHLDSANNLRIDPNDSNHLYAGDGVHGATFGFWVSTDGGENFTMPAAFAEKANDSAGGWSSDVYHVEVDPTDFNHVLLSFHSPFEFAVGGHASGILESTDGGDSWIRHYPIADLSGAGWGIWFLHQPELGIGDSNTWLLGVQLGGHWRTTDAGTSWTEVTPDNHMEHGGGQIYYATDGTLYSTGQPNIMKSTDNGATWTMVGPSFGYIGIIGDGQHLYAKAHDHNNPLLTASETDGTDWADYSPQPAEFFGGSYEYAFDAANGIVYGAFLGAGFMALKVPE